MSDKRNIEFEIIDHRAVLQKFVPRQELVVVSRWRLWVVALAMVIVMVVGFIMAPDPDQLPIQQPAQVYTSGLNPVTSPEINELKGQFVGLVSGSIESKLRVLENNIRTGSVTDSLGTLQDLKNDVRVLRAYSAPVTPVPNTTPISNSQLLQEISHLRYLIYLTLTSCGLMVAAIAGVWFKQRKRLPFNEKTSVTRYLSKH
jgi:hypothetical protein